MFSKFVARSTTIGGAAAIGWLWGYFGNKSSNGAASQALPGLPLFATVSAATQQGSLLQTADTESVPEPAPNAPRISQIMRFGFPSLSNIRALSDYVLSYDTRNRVPYWVFEHFTAATVAKNDNVDRSKCDFHSDETVHTYFRALNSDYKGSGFDRGHMAAAGNHRLSQEICKETFLLSNMAPQVGKGFNRDKWNELEMYCRRLTKAFRNVYVCTGPLYLPRREEDGKLYVKYQVIGQNHVAVPTHFFKVLVCESEGGNLEMESFVLPNQAIDDSVPINTFHVPLEVIERASGMIFFDRVNKNMLSRINGETVGQLLK